MYSLVAVPLLAKQRRKDAVNDLVYLESGSKPVIPSPVTKQGLGVIAIDQGYDHAQRLFREDVSPSLRDRLTILFGFDALEWPRCVGGVCCLREHEYSD